MRPRSRFTNVLFYVLTHEPIHRVGARGHRSKIDQIGVLGSVVKTLPFHDARIEELWEEIKWLKADIKNYIQTLAL